MPKGNIKASVLYPEKQNFYSKIFSILIALMNGYFSIDMLRFANVGFRNRVEKIIFHNPDATVVFVTLRSLIFCRKSVLKDSGLYHCLSIDKNPGNYFHSSGGFIYKLISYHERRQQSAIEDIYFYKMKNVFFVSNFDVSLYRRKFGEIAQNISYFSRYEPSVCQNIDYRNRPYDILFVGNLNYIQNIRMIQNLEKICCSGPHSWKILIAGSNPNRTVQKMIVRNNWDLIENFKDAKNIFMLSKVLVCPSRDISGVQTKILDAFAFCIPVVCYSQANYGVGALPETEIVTANTIQEFYEELKKLLDDDARLKALGVKGRRFLERNYKLSENTANFWRKILQ